MAGGQCVGKVGAILVLRRFHACGFGLPLETEATVSRSTLGRSINEATMTSRRTLKKLTKITKQLTKKLTNLSKKQTNIRIASLKSSTVNVEGFIFKEAVAWQRQWQSKWLAIPLRKLFCFFQVYLLDPCIP